MPWPSPWTRSCDLAVHLLEEEVQLPGRTVRGRPTAMSTAGRGRGTAPTSSLMSERARKAHPLPGPRPSGPVGAPRLSSFHALREALAQQASPSAALAATPSRGQHGGLPAVEIGPAAGHPREHASCRAGPARARPTRRWPPRAPPPASSSSGAPRARSAPGETGAGRPGSITPCTSPASRAVSSARRQGAREASLIAT